MKTKSKIFVLLLTLALLCGILFVSASAAETTENATEYENGFTAEYADGTVDVVAGTGNVDITADYKSLCNYVKGMTAPAKITLYQNYTATVDENNALYALSFAQDGSELDLNGHTIDTKYKFGYGIINSATGSGENGLYVYSSKSGAMITADGPKKTTVTPLEGGGYIFGTASIYNSNEKKTGKLTVGRNANGEYRGNLTAKGTCLLAVYADAVIDGITYEHTVNDNNGIVQYMNVAGTTVTIENCAFSVKNISLFSARSGNGGWKAYVRDSKIYTAHTTLTYIHSAAASTSSDGVTFENTDLYTTKEVTGDVTNPKVFPITFGAGVRLNRVLDNPTYFTLEDGYTFARVDEHTLSVNVYKGTLLYGVVPSESTAEVTFKNGDTVFATETWAVGNTPKYNTTFSMTEDPDDETRVIASSGKWMIDGKTGALAEDQAGKSLVATPEFVSTAKAFEVTAADGTVTYYIDTSFEALRSYVAGMTAAAKIKLYRNYDESTDLVTDSLAFKQAGSELDLNGKTLQTKVALGNGIITTEKALYVYSTAPGAKLLAATGGFIFSIYTEDGNLVVGRTSDETLSVEPLTIEGTALIKVGGPSTAEFMNVAYTNTVADNWGVIQYNKSNSSVALTNCDFTLIMPMFSARNANTENWSATVKESRIYTTRSNITFLHTDLKNDETTETGVTMEKTVLCSLVDLKCDTRFPVKLGEGVIMTRPGSLTATTGYVLAHTNETSVSVNGTSYSAFYEVVTDANAAKVIFTGGNAELATQIWKKGSIPSEYKADAFADSSYYWYVKPTTEVNEDTEIPATLKTKESKVMGNLTLYANITFNLYFKADGFIKGVTYIHPVTGATTTVNFAEQEPVTLNDETYYLFTISDISPKDLSEAFTLEVSLNGTTATYTVKTSLVKYATAVLADENGSESGKKLVAAILDYVREMSKEFGNKTDADPGFKAIGDRLTANSGLLSKNKWNNPTTSDELKKDKIIGAELILKSTPGFLFWLSGNYVDETEVTLTVNGVSHTCEVMKGTMEGNEGVTPYIIVGDIYVSNYTDTLKVDLDGHKITYSFDIYMTGIGSIPDYLNAFYRYILAAKAYLEAQGN